MAFSGLHGKFNGFLPQFLAVLAATLNAVSDGMNFAWSSPMLPRLKEANSPIKVTEADETWLEIVLLLGGIIGLPITTYLVDKIGRKQSTLTAASSCVFGWTLIAFANNVVYLYIARFVMGIAADIAFISSPMYISEISYKEFRGFLSGTIYVMSFSGTLIMYIIGPYVDFYVPSIVAGSLLLTQICVLPFMPDSPYFLVITDKEDEARESLRKLRGSDEIDDELNEIIHAIEQQKQHKKGKLLDLFTVPSIRKAVIVMAVLNAGQHLAGYTVITMNLHTILKIADSEYLSDYMTANLYAGLMLISNIIAILLVDKFGRKIILLISCLTTGLSLIAIAIYFNLQVHQDVTSISWIPIVAVMTFAVTFKLGMGTIPIVLTAELFPANVKAYCMASADGMFVIFSSLSIYFYQFLRDYCGGMYMPFYFFAGICLITGLYVIFFVPETKGKTLEEVQIMLKE